MRPRRLLAFLPALMLSAVLLAPTTAFAADTETMRFSATESRANATPVPVRPGR
jgi:hypothetical protein